MPRSSNSMHDYGSLVELADRLIEAAKEIKAAAKRYQKSDMKIRLSLGHEAPIQHGLKAVDRFVRDIDRRLEDFDNEHPVRYERWNDGKG